MEHSVVAAANEPTPAGAAARLGGVLRWWRLPWWLLALVTGAKSFIDNPVMGSRRLNSAGLHVVRLKVAHSLARRRRTRLAHLLPGEWREHFDEYGFFVVSDFLPPDEFARIRQAVVDTDIECRSHRQGNTITSRIPVGPSVRRRVPALAAMLDSGAWKGAMAYVASTRSQPLYYLQAVAGGVADGPEDPQVDLHSDTFQPSLKAWLFLTDVPADGRPLMYVAGSHRLSDERIAWERRKSVEIKEKGDRLSQRGSLRISPDELPHLGLPQPTHFCVPANTLVAIDTCGFHARASSPRATLRVEVWAYCRRSPFLPWTGLDVLSWRPLANRRAEWLATALDWLDRIGLAKQQWQRGARWPRSTSAAESPRANASVDTAHDRPQSTGQAAIRAPR